MSVILDALRRSRNRRDKSAPPSGMPPHVPAALGLGAGSSDAAGSRPSRIRLLGLSLLLVIALGAWAVIRVARMLIPNDVPAAAPNAAQSAAPAPAPPSSGADGAPEAEPQPPVNPAESPVVLRSGSSAPPAGQTTRASDARRDDVLQRFQLAVRSQTLGNDDEALALYRAVIDADPLNVQAHNNLGLLYHRRGATAEAVDQFRRAIAADPRYVKARSNLAVVLMAAGRLSEARAEVRTALAIEPRDADLLVNLAIIEQADQHGERAIELLVRAIGDQPTNALAHYNLALIYDVQGAVARACDHYTQFIAHAAPEQAALVSEVERRVATLTGASVPR